MKPLKTMLRLLNKIVDNVIWVSLFCGLLFWVMDSLIHSTIYPRGTFRQQMTSPDSELIWMRIMVAFITILGGAIMQIIINRRKTAEVEAERAHSFLQLVLDTIPVRVFWKDSEGRYLGCNKLFARDAGKDSPKDVIGKSDFDMGWKEQAELYRTDDRKVFKNGQVRLNYEEPQTTPDGKKIWLNTSKVPLTDLGGKTIGILGTYEEITVRKRAEEVLQERELLLQATLESISEGILIVDDKGKVKVSNSKFAEMWHIPREIIEVGDDERLINFVLDQLVDPDAFLEKVTKLYNSKASDHDFLKFKDGRIFDRRSLALHRGGKILGRIWSFRDITDQEDTNHGTESVVALRKD
jgi:PAS domain S-box-containing protein